MRITFFTLTTIRIFPFIEYIRRGGGVALYVEAAQDYELLPEYCAVTMDYEILTLKHNHELIAVVYRPPQGNFRQFMNFFENFLQFASRGSFMLTCGGDFNTDVCSDNSYAHDFNTTIYSTGFMNIITSPTRVTLSTSSTLDLFITNIDNTISHAGTIASDISDHCPIFMFYCNRPGRRTDKTDLFTFQSISEEALLSFQKDISAQDWSFIFKLTDVNVAYLEFIQLFVNIYAVHFPFKTFKPSKRIRKPWITPIHLAMIRKKNKLFHAFLRSRILETLKEFKYYRNRLNTELRRAKTAYYQHLFLDITNKQPEAAWKVINNVLGRHKKHITPDKIVHNNHVLVGEELADHFNKVFVNTAVEYSRLPSIKPLIDSPTESFALHLVTENEIYTTFMNLKNSKALDIDNLQIKPIKYVLQYIAPVLVHIFNLAIDKGVFPTAMKRSRVSVIYKSGDKNDARNYRPISVVPVFSKGLEKILSFRLTNFFDKHDLFSDAQFGFRKGRSTESALLSIKEIVVQNIDRKLFTLGLFIDYSKAFDSLDHNILTFKLSHYGVRGKPLELLHSYLNNRMQCVHLGKHQSYPLPISAGVPQGSILGPLLFNIYVNDIVNIDGGAKCIMYADDTTILLSGNDINDLILQCNYILDKLVFWSQSNRLKINPTKTKAVLFRSKNKLINIEQKLCCDGQAIEIVDEVKILGVTFTSQLTWDSHIDNLCKKLSAITGALSRCRNFLPIKTKLQIYYALFASYTSYCNLVWLTTSQRNTQRIYVLQKKIIRNIANIDYYSSTTEYFHSYNIISIKHAYEFRVLRSFYLANDSVKQFLTSLASLKLNISTRTRNSDTWLIPRFRTNYKLQSLQHNLPVILNRYKHIAKPTRKQLLQQFLST